MSISWEKETLLSWVDVGWINPWLWSLLTFTLHPSVMQAVFSILYLVCLSYFSFTEKNFINNDMRECIPIYYLLIFLRTCNDSQQFLALQNAIYYNKVKIILFMNGTHHHLKQLLNPKQVITLVVELRYKLYYRKDLSNSLFKLKS